MNLTHLRDIFRSHPVTDIPFLIILIAVFHKISLPSLRQNNFLQNRILLTKLKIKLQFLESHCLATFSLKRSLGTNQQILFAEDGVPTEQTNLEKLRKKNFDYFCLKGVLAPISGFSLLTIIFLEENQVFWCHALQLARWTIIIVYFNTMYFSFLFRQKRKRY